MSAKQVRNALEQNNYSIKLFDLRKGLSALKEASVWADVIFPVLHGEEGEGGSLQKYLKKLKKPFVGGDGESFKKGWFKVSFKKFCESEKIPTAIWKRVKTTKDILKFGFPAVLKSDNGGSSREVVILQNENDLKRIEVKSLFNSGLKLFVERFTKGVEITVGVLGDRALPVIEIVPPKGGWFDYKNKYWGKTQEIPNAPSLAEDERKRAQQIALKIHKKLNLGHLSRSDFIVCGGEVLALEVNVIPGMTEGSLFPKAAKAAGIEFTELIDKLIKMACIS